jgi:predicted PurR-regulated permease PerM
MTERPSELARITLSVLFIGGLIAGSLWILSPFLAAFIWATMIVVATWPLMRRVEGACGGHRCARRRGYARLDSRDLRQSGRADFSRGSGPT